MPSADCPECGKEIEVDIYDYNERMETAADNESKPEPFYCVDCNLSFDED